MLDIILSGTVSLIVGYLIPQPKWAQTMQVLIWEWVTSKIKKMFER